MQSISLEASGSRERSKIAIPRLDRRMPSHPLESPEKHKEERMYDPQARNSVLLMLTVALEAALVKRAENEVRVHLTIVLLRASAYQAIEIKCSGEIPSCSNCHLISADCVYDPSRRDRLKEFVRSICPRIDSFTELVQCYGTKSYTGHSSPRLTRPCRQRGYAKDRRCPQ
jgi:hypothetical protein